MLTDVESSLRLRVSEALARDVGHGLARLSGRNLGRLDLEVGDVVEVTGKRVTVCKASAPWPVLHPSDEADEENDHVVRLDGITRENAGVGLDDHVRLRKIEALPADTVLLASGSTVPHDRDLPYIRGLLEDFPVTLGDRVRVTLFGSKGTDFKVGETSPEGPVVIHAATQLMIGKPDGKVLVRAVSYEDIGGLEPQLQRVREMIELPLRYPEVFERLGIEPPKGVLLHGPPGCGKTLIARAIAHESDTTFYSISGPEVIHKFYGESEAHLRTIFDQAAASAPSIIFLDEIDAIAPRREKVGGEVEKRVVAQLLALMDGLSSRGNVVVVAATNLPNVLDPALRRPGRFDREIEIPIPSRAGRRQILEIHGRGMPLEAGVVLDQLAEITHGFVGADLEALCREAAMHRLRQVLPDIDFSLERVPFDQLDRMEVSMDDFLAALHEVQPSALREVTVEIPDARWDDVGGLVEVKKRLQSVFHWPLRFPEIFEKAHVRTTRGILLHGPTGCGKTLLARALASESGVNFISVKGPELLSMYVGESEERVRALFRKARQASPAILFFDEIDAMLPLRQQESSTTSRNVERVLSQFFAELDGVEDLHDVVVLGATNRLDLLDPALLRPGRFDEVIEVPAPDEPARREIFAVHLGGKPLGDGIDFADLASRTDGAGGAEVAEVCRRAALRAIARLLESTPAGEIPDVRRLVVKAGDLEAAMEDVLRSGDSH